MIGIIENPHFFGILYNLERVRLTGQKLKVACTEHLTPADFADLNDDFFLLPLPLKLSNK